MVTQLITFVPLYSCNNITMKMAAVVSDACLIKYIIIIEVHFVDYFYIMSKYRVAHEMSYHFIIPLKL